MACSAGSEAAATITGNREYSFFQEFGLPLTSNLVQHSFRHQNKYLLHSARGIITSRSWMVTVCNRLTYYSA